MNTLQAIQAAIEKAIPQAQATVTNGAGAGHFRVSVVCAAFTGKSVLECHRTVYSAIAPLMDGANAPVHAIDELKTSSGT